MHIHIYIYMYAHIYTYICINIYTHTHTCANMSEIASESWRQDVYPSASCRNSRKSNFSKVSSIAMVYSKCRLLRISTADRGPLSPAIVCVSLSLCLSLALSLCLSLSFSLFPSLSRARARSLSLSLAFSL